MDLLLVDSVKWIDESFLRVRSDSYFIFSVINLNFQMVNSQKLTISSKILHLLQINTNHFHIFAIVTSSSLGFLSSWCNTATRWTGEHLQRKNIALYDFDTLGIVKYFIICMKYSCLRQITQWTLMLFKMPPKNVYQVENSPVRLRFMKPGFQLVHPFGLAHITLDLLWLCVFQGRAEV